MKRPAPYTVPAMFAVAVAAGALMPGTLAFVASPNVIITGTQQRLPSRLGQPATSRHESLSMSVSPGAKLVLNDGERTKLNDGPDGLFYGYPRICYHVDEGFLKHLTELYRERIPAGGAVLDMMSSWVSHLPPEVTYERVDGHGMNLEELGRNPRLDTKRVWDLNAEPRLPFEDATYDAVVCTVSVQYLQQPEAVFADVCRVLKPGGVAIFSFSNRMFSDKAIKGWINRTAKGRARLVSDYFNAAGGFGPPEVVEREASDSAGFFEGFADMFGMVGKGDPFCAVVATKEG
ncbi:unnamed protein product [Ectocarpus sp. CCAP 1310/34]|nr:unnamed protein product [Ectocarpus sp. CCAP 1310/34]